MLDIESTIVGLATPFGSGARAILRASGRDVSTIVQRRLDVTLEHHCWRRPFVINCRYQLPDWQQNVPVGVYSWPVGRSYTGQATVEMHTLNCAPIAAEVQSQLIRDGARLAQPGEFTMRAFLSGRLDLVQAEAVLGVIQAEDVEELKLAVDQRTGGLSRPITQSRDALLDLLADLEAGLDFVEEDIEFVSDEDVVQRLQAAMDGLRRLLKTLADRNVQGRHPRVVITGPPNAGKSSLFNALTKGGDALVSSEKGTTRDYLSAVVHIADREVELVDTAGDEQTPDLIGGHAQSQRLDVLQAADIVIHCIPVTEPGSNRQAPEPRRINVRTKSDLDGKFEDPAADVFVSTRSVGGISDLLECLDNRLAQLCPSASKTFGVADRCRQGLIKATGALDEALTSQRRAAGQEVVAVSIRESLEHLGEIVGAVYTDDILDRVFSKFCIGK